MKNPLKQQKTNDQILLAFLSPNKTLKRVHTYRNPIQHADYNSGQQINQKFDQTAAARQKILQQVQPKMVSLSSADQTNNGWRFESNSNSENDHGIIIIIILFYFWAALSSQTAVSVQKI